MTATRGQLTSVPRPLTPSQQDQMVRSAQRQWAFDRATTDRLEEAVVAQALDEIRSSLRDGLAGLTARHDAEARMRRVFEVTEKLRRNDDARLAAALGETVAT